MKKNQWMKLVVFKYFCKTIKSLKYIELLWKPMQKQYLWSFRSLKYFYSVMYLLLNNVLWVHFIFQLYNRCLKSIRHWARTILNFSLTLFITTCKLLQTENSSSDNLSGIENHKASPEIEPRLSICMHIYNSVSLGTQHLGKQY